MSKLLKYLPSILAVLGAIAPIISPAVAAFWGAHPGASATVLSVLAIVNHFLPSPVK